MGMIAAEGRSKQAKGAGLGVAHGNQPATAQNEGDIGQMRQVRFGLAEQRCGHVNAMIVHIQSAGRLDILEVVTGGKRQAQQALGQSLLGPVRIEKIEP